MGVATGKGATGEGATAIEGKIQSNPNRVVRIISR